MKAHGPCRRYAGSEGRPDGSRAGGRARSTVAVLRAPAAQGPFDLLTFLHAGRKIVDGTTPYSPITSSTFTSGHAFVYPAFVAWLFAPLSLLSAHSAILLFAAFSAAAVIVSGAVD